MTYNDPEKRRAYQREYYHKKLAPGGEKYDQHLAYQREYYRENLGVDGEKHEQHLERNRRYRGERYAPGGEKHEQALERNRADKKRNIAFYVFTASSLEKFILELNKCDVLCANCHFIEHWQENDKISDLEEQRTMLRDSLREGTDLGWLKRRRIRNRIRQLETTLWFFRYKYTLQCQNCGMDHPGCLQFHHKESSEKEAEVSNLRQTSIKQLLHEIDKCEVLCANCHAKLHWNEHYEHDIDDL